MNFPEHWSSSVGLCRVCGRPSAGQHYDVHTCHGCKSFFRRAILNNTRFSPCFRNQNCYENIESRKFSRKCRECRIRKCYNVGMVFQTHRNWETDFFEMNLPEFNSQISMTKEESVCEVISQLSHTELQIEKFRNSAYNPVKFPSLDKILQSTSILGLGQKYGPMPGWPLNIDELRKKHFQLKQSEYGVVAQNIELDANVKRWLSFDIIATIEYAKTFTFFRRLCYNDKRLLTQATTLMNFDLMRVFDSYSNKFEDIRLPDGTSLYEVICVFFDSRHKGELVRRIALEAIGKTVREKLERQEYLLLRALVLCNNAVTDLSSQGQKLIQRERQKYCSALFSYCITRYGVKNGPARFGSVLSMVDVLERSQRNLQSFILFEDIYEKSLSDTVKNQLALASEVTNIRT